MRTPTALNRELMGTFASLALCSLAIACGDATGPDEGDVPGRALLDARELSQWQAGIDQRPERHVSANPREAVKMKMSHTILLAGPGISAACINSRLRIRCLAYLRTQHSDCAFAPATPHFV